MSEPISSTVACHVAAIEIEKDRFFLLSFLRWFHYATPSNAFLCVTIFFFYICFLYSSVFLCCCWSSSSSAAAALSLGHGIHFVRVYNKNIIYDMQLHTIFYTCESVRAHFKVKRIDRSQKNRKNFISKTEKRKEKKPTDLYTILNASIMIR